MQFITRGDVEFKKHRTNSHKGENGRVLVVGGSENYVGAVALAGIAALRSGADKVIVAAPERVAWAINCMSPDLITTKLKGRSLTRRHTARIVEHARKSDAVLIGNGLGTDNETEEAVRQLVRIFCSMKLPVVIDADAIKAVRIQELQLSVLTPHQGEFKILCRNSGISANPTASQKVLGSNVAVIKGRVDTIVSKNKIVYNRTGNEGMTKAGTGDVLAGLCAGFVAQGYGLFDAACISTYLNGSIGDLEKKKRGYGFVASDMLMDIKRLSRNGTVIP
jgi:hydroxyethylthiazole kinase-like uncharacterized protein yjeF